MTMAIISSQESLKKSLSLREFGPMADEESLTKSHSQGSTPLHFNNSRLVTRLTLGILSICLATLFSIIIVLSVFAVRYPMFIADLHISTMPATTHHNLPGVGSDSQIWPALQMSLNAASFAQQVTSLEPHTHMVHSHNDETRGIPLFEALSLGVRSIEADVHSFPSTHQNSTIYVGHSRTSLSSYRTLDDMYLSPLEEILDIMNADTLDTTKPNGVFFNEPNTTLQLLIDIKREPDHTYDLLLSYLQRFWVKGYLTYYDLCRDQWSLGPITVILSGEIPANVEHYNSTVSSCASESDSSPSFSHSRVMFVDAPLSALNTSYSHQSGLSVMASASLKELLGSTKSSVARDTPYLDSTQSAVIQRYVDEAHTLGLTARIWDTPQSPASVRVGVLRQLYELGVDWANADYLEETVRLL